MSSPQIEDGYTRIANELLDAILSFSFSKRDMKVIFAVIRKTYGYNKKVDDMTLTQIADITKLSLANVSRTVSALEAQNVLLKQQGRHGYLIGINKNYRKWTGCQNGNVAKMAIKGCQNGNKGLPKRQPQKTTPKDNPKREGSFAPPSLSEVREYCRERNNSVDPEQWIDFYLSKGWMVGKTKMKDWKAAVRTWERRGGKATRDEHDIFAGAL